MKNSEARTTGMHGSRRLGLAMWGLASVSMATIAGAAPQRFTAIQAADPQSSFTLDFGQGGLSSANITSTEFELEIDPATETARFLRYDQDVEPLLLPDGQGGAVSTGAIRVKICRSSDLACTDICQSFDCNSIGVFDRATGAFEIANDVYRIEFDGDLSAFGITSPFVLPSTSTGALAFDTPEEGRTDMAWIGEGLLSFIPFDYTCSVHSTFAGTNATAYVATTTPSPGAIDAREPHAIDDADLLFGWDTIGVTFNAAPLIAVAVDDFNVQGNDPNGQPLTISNVSALGGSNFELTLSHFITAGSWATIVHTPSGTHTCLGVLPGDVNGDGTSLASDAAALMDSMDGVAGAVLSDYATDLDRSGLASAEDVVRLMDLLNGAGAFEPWAGLSVGPSACQ